MTRMGEMLNECNNEREEKEDGILKRTKSEWKQIDRFGNDDGGWKIDLLIRI